MLDFDVTRPLLMIAGASGRPPAEIKRWFSDPALVEDFECGRLAPEDLFSRVLRAFPADVAFSEFVDSWNRIFTLTPGTSVLLTALSNRLRLVAATNTNVLHIRHLSESWPVMGLFDAVVASCEIGVRKPSPRFYEEVCRAAGEPPGRIVFVDDRAENVEGAARAGMTGLLFGGADRLREDLAQLGLLP